MCHIIEKLTDPVWGMLSKDQKDNMFIGRMTQMYTNGHYIDFYRHPSLEEWYPIWITVSEEFRKQVKVIRKLTFNETNL